MAKLEPPTNLSINKSSEGILLWWSAPQSQSVPIDSFVIQSRLEGEEWINLKEDISPVESQIFLPGLCKVNILEDMIWEFHESVSLSFLINTILPFLLSLFYHFLMVCHSLKDCKYELRLLSQNGDQLSMPSPSISVSTIGQCFTHSLFCSPVSNIFLRNC